MEALSFKFELQHLLSSRIHFLLWGFVAKPLSWSGVQGLRYRVAITLRYVRHADSLRKILSD